MQEYEKDMEDEYMYETVRSNFTEDELLRINSKKQLTSKFIKTTLSASDKEYVKEIAERKQKENLAKKNFNKKKKKK